MVRCDFRFACCWEQSCFCFLILVSRVMPSAPAQLTWRTGVEPHLASRLRRVMGGWDVPSLGGALPCHGSWPKSNTEHGLFDQSWTLNRFFYARRMFNLEFLEICKFVWPRGIFRKFLRPMLAIRTAKSQNEFVTKALGWNRAWVTTPKFRNSN